MLKVVSTQNLEYWKVTRGMRHKDPRLDNNPWWYLTGQLEIDEGTDQAIIYNMTDHPELQRDTIEWGTIDKGMIAYVGEIRYHKKMYFNGNIDVTVLGRPERPCIGYFWVTGEEVAMAVSKRGVARKFNVWMQRGYVVYKDDSEAIEKIKLIYDKTRVG